MWRGWLVWELRAGPAGALWAGPRYSFVKGFSGDEKANDTSQYIYHIILNFPTQYTLPSTSINTNTKTAHNCQQYMSMSFNPQPVYQYCMKCRSLMLIIQCWHLTATTKWFLCLTYYRLHSPTNSLGDAVRVGWYAIHDGNIPSNSQPPSPMEMKIWRLMMSPTPALYIQIYLPYPFQSPCPVYKYQFLSKF